MLLSKFYKKIQVDLPTKDVYGFGERNSLFTISDGIYTIWNKKNVESNNTKDGKNINGYHPVYLVKEKSQSFHVVYFKSSNAMDIELN